MKIITSLQKSLFLLTLLLILVNSDVIDFDISPKEITVSVPNSQSINFTITSSGFGGDSSYVYQLNGVSCENTSQWLDNNTYVCQTQDLTYSKGMSVDIRVSLYQSTTVFVALKDFTFNVTCKVSCPNGCFNGQCPYYRSGAWFVSPASIQLGTEAFFQGTAPILIQKDYTHIRLGEYWGEIADNNDYLLKFTAMTPSVASNPSSGQEILPLYIYDWAYGLYYAGYHTLQLACPSNCSEGYFCFNYLCAEGFSGSLTTNGTLFIYPTDEYIEFTVDGTYLDRVNEIEFESQEVDILQQNSNNITFRVSTSPLLSGSYNASITLSSLYGFSLNFIQPLVVYDCQYSSDCQSTNETSMICVSGFCEEEIIIVPIQYAMTSYSPSITYLGESIPLVIFGENLTNVELVYLDSNMCYITVQNDSYIECMSSFTNQDFSYSNYYHTDVILQAGNQSQTYQVTFEIGCHNCNGTGSICYAGLCYTDSVSSSEESPSNETIVCLYNKETSTINVQNYGETDVQIQCIGSGNVHCFNEDVSCRSYDSTYQPIECTVKNKITCTSTNSVTCNALDLYCMV